MNRAQKTNQQQGLAFEVKGMVCITQVAVVTLCGSFTDRLLHDRLTAHRALKCLQAAKRSSGASDLGRTHYTSPSQIY